jgi:hypothetical protein
MLHGERGLNKVRLVRYHPTVTDARELTDLELTVSARNGAVSLLTEHLAQSTSPCRRPLPSRIERQPAP